MPGMYEYSGEQWSALHTLMSSYQSLDLGVESILAWDHKVVTFHKDSCDNLTAHVLLQIDDETLLKISSAYFSDETATYVLSFGGGWSCKYPCVSASRDFFQDPTAPSPEEWALYLMEFGEDFDRFHPRNVEKLIRDNFLKKMRGKKKNNN